MSGKWQLRDAKAQFSGLMDASLEEGPQTVTRYGVEVAVVVAIEQWRRLEDTATLNLKDLLLAPEPRTETLVPLRQQYRDRRNPQLNQTRTADSPMPAIRVYKTG